MKNLWVRFGCFLTGHNYNILTSCSEVAIKSVKKYTAAILIVCILWFFIGYTFAARYLTLSLAGCLTAGIVAVIIIIQIERQIILTIHPRWPLKVLRVSLAFIMSLIGSVIIDQILLEKDIELEKISYITTRVDQVLPSRTEELKKQIFGLDMTINKKEEEKQALITDVSKFPTIPSVSTQIETSKVPTKITTLSGQDSVVYKNISTSTSIRTNIDNPKLSLIKPLDSAISAMRQQKSLKENELLDIRPSLEKEIKASTGFLDELKVMVSLISDSPVALCFWLLWMGFFLFIEMLVLFSKMGDKGTDYEKVILHHMNIQMRRLEVLAKGV